MEHRPQTSNLSTPNSKPQPLNPEPYPECSHDRPMTMASAIHRGMLGMGYEVQAVGIGSGVQGV